MITSWTLVVIGLGLFGMVISQWAQWRLLHQVNTKIEGMTLVRQPDAVLLLCHDCQSGIVVTDLERVGPTMAHHQEFECPARESA